MRRLNLPAILTLNGANGDVRPAVLTTLGDDTATLEMAGRTLTLPLREVERVWDGAFVALWRPPSLAAAALAPGTRDRGVPWLRERLAVADGQPTPARSSDLYDDDLKRRVMAFQRSQQLAPDGIVGEETLLRLSTSEARGRRLARNGGEVAVSYILDALRKAAEQRGSSTSVLFRPAPTQIGVARSWSRPGSWSAPCCPQRRGDGVSLPPDA